MIKNLKFIIIFFVILFVFIFDSFGLADIIGSKDTANVYTYTLNSEDDVIITSTMTLTENYVIRLDTQTASGLIIKNENENFNYWSNDTTLSVNGNILLAKIYLLNENLINATNLIISSDSYVETNVDNLVTTGGIENEGMLYVTGGKNTNIITASSGTVVFNISTNTISTNSANISQYEVISQGEFYNEAEIKANNYENYGLVRSSGTIEVSTFTNKGSFYTDAGNII
ncbi:hypothetical protein, partial [Candidatus Ruminimicrobium bovinum]|uniref:hypothetical protein n=1 Tax=Candidatus Ruminimicrobium bovinum TaxID=3242779 RepID=UPI0039B8B020